MRKIVLAAVLAALSAVPVVAQEGPICKERVELLKVIEGRLRHQLRLTAMTTDGSTIVESWANETTGAWVVLLTRPDGTSCVASVGLGFEFTDAAPEGKLS